MARVLQGCNLIVLSSSHPPTLTAGTTGTLARRTCSYKQLIVRRHKQCIGLCVFNKKSATEKRKEMREKKEKRAMKQKESD